MLYLSGCSGIEAATMAWHSLGWKPKAFSEIEKFPAAVLAHHYPDVPNIGDFTKIDPDDHLDVEVFVAGTPCQSYSMAGLRGGIKDARGNLTMHFVRIADALATRGSLRYAIWENVDGVLSMPDNAFGCLLGGLAGADAPLRSPLERGRWPDAGMVAGPRARVAWRVLDAQYWGVPQRRRRVFVVAGFGDGTDPAQVLFERKGVRGNFAASRKTREGIASGTGNSAPFGGRSPCPDKEGTGDGPSCQTEGDAETKVAVAGIELAHALRAQPNASHRADSDNYVPCLRHQAFGGNNSSGPIEVATAITAHGGSHGRLDFETETFVTHALTAEGFDASEDGTGRGTPLIAVPLMAAGCHGSNGAGIGKDGDIAFALDTTGAQAIAFSCKDHGADASDIAPTMRAMNFKDSHANAGGQLAVAYRTTGNDGCYETGDKIGALNTASDPNQHVLAVSLRGRDGGATAELSGEVMPSLRTGGGGGDKAHALQGMTVRRLTPTECHRLQGFPDDYARIPWRGKPAEDCPDGPIYRALGNSMAIPVMAWLGERIDMAEKALKETAA